MDRKSHQAKPQGFVRCGGHEQKRKRPLAGGREVHTFRDKMRANRSTRAHGNVREPTAYNASLAAWNALLQMPRLWPVLWRRFRL